MDDDFEFQKDFRGKIYQLMRELPDDKVTTYGDLAAMAGQPRAARIVGGIAHQGPDDLPWHRLVNKEGGLAIGYHGGQEVQRQMLEQDGIACTDDYKIDNFGERRWRPQEYDPNLRLL